MVPQPTALNLSNFLYFSDVTREITLDERFQRATIVGEIRPYKHVVTVPDSGLCQSFKIYLQVTEKFRSLLLSCEGESNENLKSAIKIRNTARLSCKLTTVILMV